MGSEATEMVEYEAPEGEIVVGDVTHHVKSAGEYRAESVAHALDGAYDKASTLVLTREEATLLAADFPDEAFRLGAGGDDNLIYIEHAYLRQRLNSVLGVGACVPIRRREWSEEFTYEKYGKQQIGYRVYVDLVLLVRGCVVGEAIGDSVYYPSNPKTNYSDALESAKSNAFRRCAKEFGIGLQAWMKGWGEGWKERNRGGKRPAPPSQQVQPKPAAAKEPAKPPQPVELPKRQNVNFEPPLDWPDTEIHDLKIWIDGFTKAEHFKVALGMFLNEPALTGNVRDWESVLRHYAQEYKSKAKVVATVELNKVIKAALDKLEMDMEAERMLDSEATAISKE